MTNLEKVDEFLNEAGVFFVSTVDGDQPVTRPFNVHYILDGKLCFETGDKKNVYKQMMANPKVQITAINRKTEWLRITGTVSLAPDQTMAEQHFAHSKFIRENYERMGMMLHTFQIDEATVEKNTWQPLEKFDLYE